MAVRASEIKSGVFVVLAVGVLIVLIFAVGNLKERLQPKAEYHAFLSDAKFLKAHDAVTYGGIRVGQIERVEVAAGRLGTVKVVIRIDPNIDVKEDSILTLKQDGMLGQKYLEVSAGTEGKPRARSGSELKAEIVPTITDLSATIKGPLTKIDELLDNLNKVLGSSENQNNVAQILADIRGLIAAAKDDLHKTSEMAVRTGEKAQTLLEDVDGMVQEMRPSVATILNNVDDLVVRLTETAERLNQLTRDADTVVLQNSKNVYETIRALRDTAYHMEQAAKRIRANPSVVLFGGSETPEERARRDEAQLRLHGRTRRYDKEIPK